MKTKFVLVFLSFFLLVACSSASGPVPVSTEESGNLTAALSAPDIVQLSWEPVEGATGYLLEVSLRGDDYFEMGELPPDQVAFTDYLAPEQTEISYQLTALTGSGQGETSRATITTGARVPNPYDVVPAVDDNLKTSQAIGPEGGSIDLVDSNGVEYTFTVPAGSLLSETTFTVTPLTELDGWPLDGAMLAGARIEPEDVLLGDPAALTITLPDEPSGSEMSIVGFGSLATGEDFFLQPVELDTASASLTPDQGIRLVSYSLQKVRPKIIIVNPNGVAGAGHGTKSSISKFTNGHTPKSRSGARAQKEAAAGELQPLGNLRFTQLLSELVDIEIGIERVSDCQSLRTNILSLAMWEMKANNAPSQEVPQRERSEGRVWDKLVDSTKKILDSASEDCEKNKDGSKSQSVNCAKFIANMLHSSGVSNFWKNYRSRMADAHGKGYVSDTRSKLSKCNSAYTASGGGSAITISGTICETSSPFTLTGVTQDGVTITFSFEPSTDTGGHLTYSGAGGGFTVSGSGTYVISSPVTEGAPLTMTMSEQGCVNEVPDSCQSTEETITLTPTESCKQ